MAQTNVIYLKIEAPVLELVQNERAKALSAREWKFRLAGYGYAIKEVGDTQILTTLPHGVDLGVLPAHMH